MAVLTRVLNTLQLRKPEKALVKSLDRGIVNINREERAQHTSSGMFSISNLGKCPRRLYMQHENPPDFPASVLYKMLAGKDSGARVVRFLQQSGKLFGLAVTPDKKVKDGVVLEPGDTYCELGLRDFGRKISGKIDMFFLHGKQVLLVENKSASTNFQLAKKKSIEDRLGSHIQQANMYVGLIRYLFRRIHKNKKHRMFFYNVDTGHQVDPVDVLGAMNLDGFILLYEDKNKNAFFPYWFDYDHDLYKDGLMQVQRYFEAISTKKIPPIQKCDECRLCDIRKECGR